MQDDRKVDKGAFISLGWDGGFAGEEAKQRTWPPTLLPPVVYSTSLLFSIYAD